MGEFARAITLRFVEYQCGGCGVWFAMEKHHYNQLVESRGGFYCPNGCSRRFIGKTEAERLREKLDAERARTAFERRRADREQASARAYKGQVTKIKNRIGKGVCPFCNRSFQNLHRHMESKHPDECGVEE